MDIIFDNAGGHRGLSGHLWRDIPTDIIYGDPKYLADGLGHVDDFHYIEADRYTVTQATSGTFALSAALGEGGVAVADTGATTDGQGPNVQEAPWVAPEVGQYLGFECRIRPSDIGTPGDLFVGLSESDTTVIASGALTPNSYIGFKALGSADLTFVQRKDGGTEQASDAGVATLTEDTWIRLGFLVEPSGIVTPYVNGRAMDGFPGSGGSTTDYRLKGSVDDSLPTEILGRSLAVQSAGTTQPTVAIDHWAVAKKKSYLAA